MNSHSEMRMSSVSTSSGIWFSDAGGISSKEQSKIIEFFIMPKIVYYFKAYLLRYQPDQARQSVEQVCCVFGAAL
jgi:hypothetical protein